MNQTQSIVHLVVWIISIIVIVIVASVILRKLIYLKRFCVSCQTVTRHCVDYGHGPVMGCLMAFYTLGWRHMIQQYYPVKCVLCGQRYQTESVEAYRKQIGLIEQDVGPKARDWKGLGGDRNWKELKYLQRLYLSLMMVLGILFFLFLHLSRKGFYQH